MSEIAGKRILDLERVTSKFGKMIKKEEEVSEFKEWIKKTLDGEIASNLTGLLRELQENLPTKISWKEESDVLVFGGYGSKYVLTREGVLDKRRSSYAHRGVESIVHAYLHPNLTFYPNAHNPSIAGAKFLWKKIVEIEESYGIKLEGKYLLNKAYLNKLNQTELLKRN